MPSIAIDISGDTIVSGGADYKANFWNITTGKLCKSFSAVFAVSISDMFSNHAFSVTERSAYIRTLDLVFAQCAWMLNASSLDVDQCLGHTMFTRQPGMSSCILWTNH